jgi:hypothetical protein
MRKRRSNTQNLAAIPVINVKVPAIKLSPEFKKKFTQTDTFFPYLNTSYNERSQSVTRYIGTCKGRRVPLKVIYKHQGYLSLQEIMKERIKVVSAKREKKLEEDAEKLIKFMMTQVVDIKVDVKSKERLISRLKRMSERRAKKIWSNNLSRTYY